MMIVNWMLFGGEGRNREYSMLVCDWSIKYNNHRTEIMLSRRKIVLKIISTGKLFTNFHETKFKYHGSSKA